MNYRPEGLVGSSRFGMHFSLRPTLNHTLPSQFSNLIMLIASEAIHTSPSYMQLNVGTTQLIRDAAAFCFR